MMEVNELKWKEELNKELTNRFKIKSWYNSMFFIQIKWKFKMEFLKLKNIRIKLNSLISFEYNFGDFICNRVVGH